MADKANTPFTFVNAINSGREIEVDSAYVPFVVSRYYSQYIDTVLVANELNVHRNVTPDQHYEFLANSIRPRKRPFRKWPKPQNHEAVGIISRYYDVPMRQAYTYVQFYSDEEIASMKEQLSGE